MKLRLLGALVTGVALLMASPLWADSTIMFDLSSCAEAGLGSAVCPNTDAGTNVITYTSGGQTLLATGNAISASTNHLFVKQGGSGESGLGMAADSDGEIQPSDFITLDFSSLFKAGFKSVTLSLGSIQSGEAGNVCQGSSDTAIGILNCKELNNPTGGLVQSAMFTFTGASDDILSITADNGDVLILGGVTAGTTSPVPEPSSLLLLGSGLIGLGVLVRRHFKA